VGGRKVIEIHEEATKTVAFLFLGIKIANNRGLVLDFI
jgi:hypothetical protein